MANRDDIGPRIPEECSLYPDFCTTITKNPKSTREYFNICFKSFKPLEFYVKPNLDKLYISPEALEEIRNWGTDCIDEKTKNEILDCGSIVAFYPPPSTLKPIGGLIPKEKPVSLSPEGDLIWKEEKKECTCSSRDLFDKGCTCGYIAKD